MESPAESTPSAERAPVTTDPERAAKLFAQSASIMARLRAPDGCPWDREQNFDSVRKHTLEEVYEVFDAIDRRDFPHLAEELWHRGTRHNTWSWSARTVTSAIR